MAIMYYKKVKGFEHKLDLSNKIYKVYDINDQPYYIKEIDQHKRRISNFTYKYLIENGHYVKLTKIEKILYGNK